MLTQLITYWFSRSRLRRGPKFDPKLKDYSQLYNVKKQVKAYRQEFQTADIQESFTDVMKTKKPKLSKRFKIDEAKLSRHLKKLVNRMVSPQTLIAASDEEDDLKFLNESKSHLYDQQLEIDFEQKFQKELFMKKQTDRMLKKQDRNFKNFLPENHDNKYNKYLHAKNKLKNSRIDNMMNYKRNNQDLQLLIESGLIDEPDNIKMLIDKMNGKEVELTQRAILSGSQTEQRGLVAQDQLENHNESVLKRNMLSNIQGPQATRDYEKIQTFLDRYQERAYQAKQKASEDVDLLLQVKQYERNLFLSRYDQINFRFRGRVNFDYFKQYELMSYIKHEQIEPKDLLSIFEDNKYALSRFNVPIITPAVMSRIYSKTSTYRFSEDDQNNHINMLNDPLFKSLESTLFRQLDKISDELFCDSVWAYTKNHQLQRGLLNIKKANAIQRAIFNELGERINRLKEQDLGLLMKSIIKLSFLKDESYNDKWGEIIQALEHRLPQMTLDYEWQSVMQFITLLPTSDRTTNLMARNVHFFKKYNWEQKSTLFTFTRVSSALINHQQFIDLFELNKTFIVLKEIVALKFKEITSILPTMNINDLAKNIVVFQELNKMPFGPQVPALIMYVAKKQVVNGIRTQKHKIYQFTIPTLIANLSTYDYFQNTLKKSSKYLDADALVTPYKRQNFLRQVTLKSMLPNRVFTFNSQLYFVYHQMAKFLRVQESQISLKSLSESLFGLSLVQYKNQEAYDILTYRLLERLENDQKLKQKNTLSVNQVINLMKVVGSYSLQKRNSDVVEEICDKIFTDGKGAMNAVHTSILIHFFGSYCSIFTMPTQEPSSASEFDTESIRWERNKNFAFSFLYCFSHYMSPLLKRLETQELITLYYVQSLILNNFKNISTQNPHLQSQYLKGCEQAANNLELLLTALNTGPQDRLNLDYRFVLSLCTELNQLNISNPKDISWLGSFQDLEKKFHDRHIKQILAHQEHVGVVSPYIQVYQKIAKRLKQQNDEVKEKTWRIQDQKKRKVYFFATFEHLMTRNSEQHTTFSLFGLWKVYAHLFKKKGWDLKLICTMLEK